MNLSQLRFVKAVATTGSFTSGARTCFVTQPTLSNGIAELEKELGQRLFSRTTRKVVLTPFGEHLLPAISEVLNAQDSLMLRAKAYLNPQKRLLRIGTSPLISPVVLKAIVEPFQQQNPDVDLVFRELNLDDLYKMLQEAALDFVFGAVGVCSATRGRKLERAPLYREPLYFVPRRSEWQGPTRKHSVKFEDISGETFVMVPDSCGLAQATRSLFRSHRCRIHEYSGQALSYQVLEQWADLGIGAAVLPKSKVTGKAEQTLSITDKKGRLVFIEFEAVWSPRDSTATHLSAFAAHLRRIVPSLVKGLVESS